ncbi:MAG: phage major capsid protein [Sphingomonas oligoaromativorans]
MALANPSAVMNEIVTTTLLNRGTEVADNVTKNNALLNRLRMRGKVKPYSGGYAITEPVAFAENGTFKRYSGFEPLNITPGETMSSAVYPVAMAACAVTLSGQEMLANSGEEAILDLLEERITIAVDTLTNNIALDCYSDGTADGGRQIGGLGLLVGTNPNAGVVGGFDRSSAVGAFWRNKKYSGVTDGGAAVTQANIIQYMQALWSRLVRGADKPDLMPADNNFYNLYWAALQAQQRFTNDTDEASAGFGELKFQTADVVMDGGVGGGAPVSSLYMLNTKYLKFRPHKDRNFVPIGGDRTSSNQDAVVKLIGFAGNMTMSNASLQGVLVA